MLVHLLLNVVADLSAAHQPHLLLLSVAKLGAATRLRAVHNAEGAACVRVMRIATCTTSRLLETRVPLSLAYNVVLLERAAITASYLTTLTLNYYRIMHLLLLSAGRGTGNIETLAV